MNKESFSELINKDKVIVINHPLLLDKTTRIRNKETQKKEFFENVNEIASLMAYEVFKDLNVEDVSIETPLTKFNGKKVCEQNIILCPVLRAGLGMVRGIEYLVPNARISHFGVYRDEKSLEPKEYYFKYPNVEKFDDVTVYILDPMLATGGSSLATINKLKGIGFKNIVCVSILGTAQGVNKIHSQHKDIKIYLASLDEKLDENGWIVPGLGDAGDRIFGTI